MSPRNRILDRTLARWVLGTAFAAFALTAQAQKLYFENFETVPLGKNVEEALAGDQVWSATGPANWVEDDSAMPGLGTPTDGIVEWAGWSFANRDWWVRTAGDQRRSEFLLAEGTVMIADPDEWDDATHTKGLFNAYATTPSIDISGKAANSLVVAFDSSWRPEGFDDGEPNFPVGPNGERINNQTALVHALFGTSAPLQVLKFDSDRDSATYHADGEFINESVIVPLNNPAGATTLKLRFGMVEAANDWWWAVDNIAVGEPPLVTGVSATGAGFTIRVSEALGKTVNDSRPVTATLDGQTVTATVARDGERVLVSHDQSPKIFAPRSKHAVNVSFTTGAGRQITDTAEFVAPSYTFASATPDTITATISEKTYLSVDETKAISLTLNGTAVTGHSVRRVDLTAADGSDLPDQIVVTYKSATGWAAGSKHTLGVTFTTKSAQVVVDSADFAIPAFATLPPALGTALGTGSTPGVRWRTHQLEASRGTTIALAEQQLAGTLGASIHDASAQVAGGYFELPWVNLDQLGADAGNFRGSSTIAGQEIQDDTIPGIPGSGGGTDNIAGEALAYVELPTAGVYTMVVNSDDGFQVSVGNATNTTFQVLGKFDGGRGSADSVFYFRAEKAGVYLFRTLWFEGGGGANVEWFTVLANGTRALVGGTQPGALKAFRTRTVAEPALPSAGAVSRIGLAGGKVTIEYTGTLKSAATVTGPYAPVANASSPYSVDPNGTQQFFLAE
jgi:hypothetical protein